LTLFIKNKKIIFLYFFTQAIASFLIIISIIFNYILIRNFSLINLIIIIGLLIKLGLPPFHFWFPIISIYIDWNIILILFSIQKIIPFIIISLINLHSFYFIIIITLTIIIPPIIIFKIINLKKLIAYSSINQIGWMLFIIIVSSKIWLIYLSIYFSSIIIFIFIISYYSSSSNFNSWIKLTPLTKIIIISIIINISGLPPFSFFFFKWYNIFILISSININIILLIILFRSLIIIYIYINIIIKISILNRLNSKFIFINFKKTFFFWITIYFFLSIFLLII